MELNKVALTGLAGSIAAMTLADVATIMSIAVGAVTFCYVGAKLYFLIRSGGKDQK